jgi:nucleoid-associated protein YgaU
MAVLLVAAGSVALAGAAQAIGHSGAQARPGTAAAGAAIAKVEVRPGQSLWTLAEAYDPNADTRQVIQEILQLNSMSTDQVQPGQVLWMPRD